MLLKQWAHSNKSVTNENHFFSNAIIVNRFVFHKLLDCVDSVEVKTAPASLILNRLYSMSLLWASIFFKEL